MQFEEFDNKIQQAAENHHPTYDEQAWTKMEKLLDKHLPQKKDDKRRIIFFLLLFLLLGGGAMFIFINKSPDAKQIQTNKQTLLQENSPINKPVNLIPEKIELNSAVAAEDKKINETNNPKETITSLSVEKTALLKQQASVKSSKNKNTQIQKPNAPVSNDQNIIADQSVVIKNDKQVNSSKPTIEPGISNNTAINPVDEKNVEGKNKNIQKEKKSITSDVSQKGETNTNNKIEPVIVKKTEKIRKSSGKKSNSFFITLSLAPDVSGTGMVEKPGTLKLTRGAGLGYTFNKFTLRSGFYSARKIYTAKPDEYHPPASFWNYYPNLKTVDADCKVYEIPLLLSYNFGNSTKQNWLATAGLSSYIMKRETYHYSYKDQWGQDRYKTWTINNENKHYFSKWKALQNWKILRNLPKNWKNLRKPSQKLENFKKLP